MDGKIAAISEGIIHGREEFECLGKVVSPGFVDMHMHEDPINDTGDGFKLCIADSMLKMGVTTAVGGNCGIGPVDSLKYLELADALGYPINIGLLSSHDNLRKHIGDFDKYNPVNDDQVEKMRNKLEEELDGGTLGLSFGVRYVPGLESNELKKLTGTAARKRKLLAAHVRDDAAQVIPSIMELAEIAEEEGARLQISHIGSMAAFGQMEQVLSLVDSLNANGLDIGLDCYPYSAFATLAGSTTYDEGFLKRYSVDYSALEVSQGEFKGRRLDEISFQKIRAEHPEYIMIAHVMKEDEIEAALRHPRTAIASDGILNEGFGHPRAAGTFPRILGYYSRDRKLLSLFDVIRKITSLPSERIGIDKGHLSIGADADITVFDPDKIIDTAGFSNPISSPHGLEYVIIGGKLALVAGEIIRKNLGRAVRL
jgi:N-acyl-D-amino-acid deacylase